MGMSHETKRQTPDVTVYVDNSIALVRPVSDAARDWIAEYVSDESQWFGGALVVEPRYLDGLIGGMIDDGLTVGREKV